MILVGARLVGRRERGCDYVAKTRTIAVKGDGTRESSETFFVDLFGPSSNALISTARGIGTILNDDDR
jgi:hypothetical protein